MELSGLIDGVEAGIGEVNFVGVVFELVVLPVSCVVLVSIVGDVCLVGVPVGAVELSVGMKRVYPL